MSVLRKELRERSPPCTQVERRVAPEVPGGRRPAAISAGRAEPPARAGGQDRPSGRVTAGTAGGGATPSQDVAVSGGAAVSVSWPSLVTVASSPGIGRRSRSRQRASVAARSRQAPAKARRIAAVGARSPFSCAMNWSSKRPWSDARSVGSRPGRPTLNRVVGAVPATLSRRARKAASAFADGDAESRGPSESSLARITAACWYASYAVRIAPASARCNATWARTSDVVAGERGSLVTVTRAVALRPSTVSLSVYVPGATRAPTGDAGVSPGLALISNVCTNAGGGSARRSQFVRFPPASVGSRNGGATQKFGCGGRAASGTGGCGTLDRCRTVRPAESSTSSVTSAVGRALSQ